MNLDLKNTTDWKPLCFARLVMQLPPQAAVGVRHTFWGDELVLRKDLRSMELLKQEVAQRQQTFKSLAHKDFGTRYIQTYDLNKRGVTVWGYESGEVNELNGRHLRTTHDYFFSLDPFRVWYSHGDVGQDHLQSALDYQGKLAGQIRALAEGEIPRELGYAIEGGLVRTDEAMAEVGEMWFTLPFFRSPIKRGQVMFEEQDNTHEQLVIFTVTTMVNGSERTQLLDRLSLVQSALMALKGVRVIRKGARKLNGIEGQEYLYRERSSDDRWTAYVFRWEAAGKIDDPYLPNIVVEMNVKLPTTPEYPAPPFKNDDEALAFWDAIVGSLRMRPVVTASGAQISQDGRTIPPVTCGSDEVVPRTGVYRGTLDTSHPDAAYFNSRNALAFKRAGEKMIRLGAYGAEHLVTWTWIREA